jgi:PST family polysaccharide transporter
MPQGVPLQDLKGKTVRGGFISICAQPVIFLLRTGSLILLARILLPEDFGLVGMVTAVTGVIGLFKDAGLSMVTIQRSDITDEQVSTLFWINIAVGVILVGLSIAVGPLLVSFYHEPRLFWITVALGSGFLFNAAATGTGHC